MGSNYDASRIPSSPSIQSIPSSASAPKGKMSGNDVTLLNELSNVVKSYETKVLNAMENIDNLSKQDLDRIKLEQKQLTSIKQGLKKRANLPLDKQKELIAKINKVYYTMNLILLKKEELSPKTPLITTPKAPKDLKFINDSIEKLNGNIDALSSKKEQKETQIGFIKLELEFLKDDLKNLSSEDRKIAEAEINKCYSKLSLSPPPERLSTSQSQSTPQAKPGQPSRPPSKSASPPKLTRRPENMALQRLRRTSAPDNSMVTTLQTTTIEAISTTAQSPAVAKTVSLLQKMIIPDKAQQKKDPEYIKPEVFLNSYHLVATSEELFQSLSICLNDNTLGEQQKLQLLKFATTWLNTESNDVEYKSNEKLQIAVRGFIDQAKSLSSTESKELKKEFNRFSLAEHNATERASQITNQLEVTIPAKTESADDVFKSLDNLKPEEQLNRIKDAKLWFKDPTNYHLYSTDHKTKKLFDDFMKTALKSGNPQVKQAAIELHKEKEDAMLRFKENNNIISPIAMRGSEERNQKIKEFSHDLLIMQANIMTNIPNAEFFQDMGKFEGKHLEQRPNFSKGVIFTNQLSNFVENQIISSGIEAQKAIQEAQAESGKKSNEIMVNTVDIKQHTMATIGFFLDLAEACYNNGDYASYMTIVATIENINIQRLFTVKKGGNPVSITGEEVNAISKKFSSLTKLGGFPKMDKLRATFNAKIDAKSQKQQPLIFPLQQLGSDLALISAGNPAINDDGTFNVSVAVLYNTQITSINKQKKSLKNVSTEKPQSNLLTQISNTPNDHDDFRYNAVNALREGK